MTFFRDIIKRKCAKKFGTEGVIVKEMSDRGAAMSMYQNKSISANMNYKTSILPITNAHFRFLKM